MPWRGRRTQFFRGRRERSRSRSTWINCLLPRLKKPSRREQIWGSRKRGNASRAERRRKRKRVFQRACQPNGGERLAAERIVLVIVSEWNRGRKRVALNYRKMAGFKIYVEEENGSGVKRPILGFWKHGSMSARTCFLCHLFVKNIADCRQVLRSGKRRTQQKRNKKDCQDQEKIWS